MIYLWTISLPATFSEVEDFCALLPKDEREHLDRMGSEKRKIQFTMGHALARIKIAEVFDVVPQSLPIIFTSDKKPELHIPEQNWFVSLSHSNHHAICALSPVCIGIDLEEIKDRKYLLDVARHAGTAEEIQDGQLLPKSEHVHRFQQIWSLKEAFYKAADLSAIDVMKNTVFKIKDNMAVLHKAPVANSTAWHFELHENLANHVLAVAYKNNKKIPVKILQSSIKEINTAMEQPLFPQAMMEFDVQVVC